MHVDELDALLRSLVQLAIKQCVVASNVQCNASTLEDTALIIPYLTGIHSSPSSVTSGNEAPGTQLVEILQRKLPNPHENGRLWVQSMRKLFQCRLIEV